MGGIMQNALIMKNYHPAVIRHHYLSGSFRFLTSTPLKKYSQHVNCHSKYQAILRWNRSLSPLHANSSHNAFYSSSSWSKGIFTSYFGQNFVSVKNFDHLSRHGRAKAGQRVNVLVKWTKSLLFNLIKVFGTLCLIISLVIIAAPSFLSSSVGLHSAVWLTNKVIPGKASIKSISIGWTTPVSIEEVLLEGTDGKTVLVIPKIETKASLWSFIAGRAGFGNCTITSPIIDLQQEKDTGLSHLALAICRKEKIKYKRKRRVSGNKVLVPAVHVDLVANIKAPGGNLQVTNGKLILPEDVAAVVGHKLVADMLLGHFATQNSQELEADNYNAGLLPLHMGLWSECAEAKAEGFLDPRKMKIQLIKPIKVEMDLTPAVGRFYLRRINPLLGEILGPAVADEDMPDMIVYISPLNLILPAENYEVHIEPMKAVLARGPLAGGILSLLSKGRTNITPGSQVGVETSAIKADFDTGGGLTCPRVDLFLAGRIHVVTWGIIDWIEETIKMTLAIPGKTLQDVMGLSDLPSSYYLEIPLRGTFDQPQVDWKTASLNIAQLVLHRYVNVDGTEIPSPGVYNENGSVLYHSGYAYAPQMPYGPYSPAGTPLPTIRADGQLFGTQQYPYPAPFYQQPVPPGVQYISSPTPLSQGELSSSVGVDQATFAVDGSNANFVNGNGMTVAPRPGYPMAYGSYGRGVLPVTITSPGYQDPRHGYDGIRTGGSWSDSAKVSEGQQRPNSGSAVPAVTSQTIPALGPFGQNIRSVSHVTGAQRPPSGGMGPAPGTFNRVYSPNRMFPQGNSSGRGSPGYSAGRSWIAVDKNKQRGRGNGSLCNCIGPLDVLNEQNRGPRTARFRNQQMLPGSARLVKEQSLTMNGNNEISNVAVNRELYNQPEFVTKYTDAKFFIIKSYSEDNIHKSIKYGVWASTQNGNKKLDAAYREAQEKTGSCPIFLFFSVNASGQFCGVAEMVGPVDFNKSVDYWQQDKWSGQFPVKWHIIKDVSNSQLRHITLENNDNKPVTNSRDTQEVKFEQGIEMLNIFKNYVSKMSILDDFQFYESRQKAMQEKRARQQASYQSGGEFEPDDPLKAQEGNAGEAAAEVDIKLRQTPADLTSALPSPSDGLSCEGGWNKNNPSQKLSLEERGDLSSVGDALKAAKPTTDEGDSIQDEEADKKVPPKD